MNGRLASPRYSRAHSQTPHGVAQYVQNTAEGAFHGGSGTASQARSLPPRALPPGHDILSETIPSDYLRAMFELWFFPERGGFYLYGFLFVCFSILAYFFSVIEKKKERKKKTNLSSIKVLLSYQHCLV